MASTEQGEEQAAARVGAAPVAGPAAPPDSAVVTPDAAGEPAPLPARRARRVVLATPPEPPAPEPPADAAPAATAEPAVAPATAVATPPRAPMQAWTPSATPAKATPGRNGGAPANGKAAPPAAGDGGRRRVLAEAPAA